MKGEEVTEYREEIDSSIPQDDNNVTNEQQITEPGVKEKGTESGINTAAEISPEHLILVPSDSRPSQPSDSRPQQDDFESENNLSRITKEEDQSIDLFAAHLRLMGDAPSHLILVTPPPHLSNLSAPASYQTLDHAPPEQLGSSSDSQELNFGFSSNSGSSNITAAVETADPNIPTNVTAVTNDAAALTNLTNESLADGLNVICNNSNHHPPTSSDLVKLVKSDVLMNDPSVTNNGTHHNPSATFNGTHAEKTRSNDTVDMNLTVEIYPNKAEGDNTNMTVEPIAQSNINGSSHKQTEPTEPTPHKQTEPPTVSESLKPQAKQPRDIPGYNNPRGVSGPSLLGLVDRVAQLEEWGRWLLNGTNDLALGYRYLNAQIKQSLEVQSARLNDVVQTVRNIFDF